jgi:Protein of unknown function (DUF1552)
MTIKKGVPLSRRAVLRGAGAFLALPYLEAMAPRRAFAAAAGGPPIRLGIVSVTGGTVLESWRPADVGPLGKLPSILRPLEPFKDDLLILSGLAQSGDSEGLNAHEHCAYLHLTGAEKVGKVEGKIRAAVSVDQAAAKAVAEQTYLSSMELGLNGNQYSFRTPDSYVPYEANPRLVFERMFRGRKPVVPNWSRRGVARAETIRASSKDESPDRAVIDLVLDEAKALRRDLGRADRHKLDEYLHSVESVEKRVTFLEGRQAQEALDAASPGPSKLILPSSLPAEGTPIWKITQPVERDPERHGDYIALMADLMVLAFQTDTTRVATLAAGSDEASFPGVVTVGYERHCHTLEHQGNAARVEDADPIAREACRQIHAWYTALFARMVARMKAIDEGGSTLLDNTLLLYTSYMADGGHGRDDYPVLIAGKAGGTLRTGRHIAYRDKTPTSNLYVEILNRMGVDTDTFGDNKTSKNAAYEGRLPGLV